jgi:hypothetical protein
MHASNEGRRKPHRKGGEGRVRAIGKETNGRKEGSQGRKSRKEVKEGRKEERKEGRK